MTLAGACAGQPPAFDFRPAHLLPADSHADANAAGVLSFAAATDSAWPVTVTLSGLAPTETYRLTLNGYPGDTSTNSILAECPIEGKLDSGRYLDSEGYCDFRLVTTNGAGSAIESLQLALPPAEYRLKFFVKRNGGADGRDYRVVLKADELRFSILPPASRVPVALLGALVAVLLLGVVALLRRTRSTAPLIPPATSAPSAAPAEPPAVPAEAPVAPVEPAASAPSVLQSVFRRSGQNPDIWEIGSTSQPMMIPHVDGFSYIARLLANPDREISALDLYWSVSPPPASQVTKGQATEREAAPRALWSSQGDLMDDATIRDCLRELNDLRAGLDKVERDSGPPREAAEYKAKIKAVERYLRGQGRSLPNQDLERCRVAVARALSRAYEKIEERDTVLALGLRKTIHSGNNLSYRPRHDSPVIWLL